MFCLVLDEKTSKWRQARLIAQPRSNTPTLRVRAKARSFSQRRPMARLLPACNRRRHTPTPSAHPRSVQPTQRSCAPQPHAATHRWRRACTRADSCEFSPEATHHGGPSMVPTGVDSFSTPPHPHAFAPGTCGYPTHVPPGALPVPPHYDYTCSTIHAISHAACNQQTTCNVQPTYTCNTMTAVYNVQAIF